MYLFTIAHIGVYSLSQYEVVSSTCYCMHRNLLRARSSLPCSPHLFLLIPPSFSLLLLYFLSFLPHYSPSLFLSPFWQVVTLREIFNGASIMNVDIGAWDVGKVTSMRAAFSSAVHFSGTGMWRWKTPSLTDLTHTFNGATRFDVDLNGWDISKVTKLASTFANAVNFKGTGLSSWDTAAVTSLDSTFYANSPSKFNGMLGSWDVSSVQTMASTFQVLGTLSTTAFVGSGLSKWITTSVTNLLKTFNGASAMNAAFDNWDVTKVVTMELTFARCSSFEGSGLDQWSVDKVADFTDVFVDTLTLTPCNKRAIVDRWKTNPQFDHTTTYITGWASFACDCPEGQEYNADVLGTTICVDCATGRYSDTNDDSTCFPKSTTSCAAGNEFKAGTSLLTDDNTCPDCDVGKFKATTGDTLPCTPYTVTSCGIGRGLTPGNTLADTVCEVCDGGRYSGSIGGDACVPHSSPPCAKGSGSVDGTAIVDVSCSPCSSGKFSTYTNNSPCTNSTCPAGQYLGSAANEPQRCSTTCVPGKYSLGSGCEDCTPGMYSTGSNSTSCKGTECGKGTYGQASQASRKDATCGPCGIGKYTAVGGQTTCKLHSVATCGLGKGYVVGSASVDNAECADCATGTFSGKDDNSACSNQTVVTCGAGKEYVAGSASIDDAACLMCATGMFNSNDDTSPCANKTVPFCGPGEVLRLGSAVADDASCSVPSETAKKINKDMDATQAAANDLNKNSGNLTSAEAIKKRTQLIKDIGTLVSSPGITGTDLATANAKEKQGVIAGIAGALSSAVANASQINGPSGGSEIIQILKNMTDLATSIDATFDEETTGKILDTISTVLDVRGTTAPDSAIDKIDQIIRTLVANKPAGVVITVKTDRVAITSSTTSLTSSKPPPPGSSSLPQLGSGWLSAFSSGGGTAGGGSVGSQSGNRSSGNGAAEAAKWQDTVANMTAEDALVALDDAVRVQFHVDITKQGGSGGTGTGKDGDGESSTAPATKTTLVQYAGGRNPFWPSEHSSSDIITLTISLLPKSTSSFVNVSFETRTPLW